MPPGSAASSASSTFLQHLGIPLDDLAAPAELPEEIRRLADAGRKIEAIKAHREAFGSGLAEAKEAVEAYLAGR
jgi:ribosomal protein L7/L12